MVRKRLTAEADHRLRSEAGHRCGYCLSPQHLVFAPLEIEHLLPIARGGSDDTSNLWLCCSICNGHKSDKVEAPDEVSGERYPLFNPRHDSWQEHFAWSSDGLRIIGLTAVGRVTVAVLKLDSDPIAIEVRSYWVAAGWHPPCF